DLPLADRRQPVAHGVIGDQIDDALGVRIRPPRRQRVAGLRLPLVLRPLGRAGTGDPRPAPRPVAQIGRQAEPPPHSVEPTHKQLLKYERRDTKYALNALVSRAV